MEHLDALAKILAIAGSFLLGMRWVVTGSSLAGLTATQVGTDNDWNYTQSTINRNNKCLAQKGDQLVLLTASNTANIGLTITPVRQLTGVFSCVYSPSGGDWAVIVQPGE